MNRMTVLLGIATVLAGCSPPDAPDSGAGGDVVEAGTDATPADDHVDAGPLRDVAPFACGEAGVCDPATEYCVIEWGDPPMTGQTMPAVQMCTPLPAECLGAPSCDCIYRHGMSWCASGTAPMLICSDTTGAIYCTQSGF